jgi:hypothetical protein
MQWLLFSNAWLYKAQIDDPKTFPNSIVQCNSLQADHFHIEARMGRAIMLNMILSSAHPLPEFWQSHNRTEQMGES